MVTYEVWQGGIMVASASSNDANAAFREAAHYAAQYVQDGEVEIRSKKTGKVVPLIPTTLKL